MDDRAAMDDGDVNDPHATSVPNKCCGSEPVSAPIKALI